MNSEPVRVIQLVQHLSLGGATLMAMLLAERLDRRRYDVMLAAGPHAGAEGDLSGEMRQRGIKLVTVSHLRRSPHPWHDARAVLALRSLLRRERPHIVHTHGSKPKLLLPWAARLAPVPVKVAHIWGWEWQPAPGPITRALFTAASRLGTGSYDALVACSEAMRRQGIERRVGRPDQYQVILPPVDLEAFTPEGREQAREEVRQELGIAPDAYVVASVTRLGPQKAPLDLVRAAALVIAQRPDARFLVVGGGPLERAVTSEIAAHGLGDKVLLLGPRRDVPRVLKASDLFALTSVWEPFGIVYLEAAAVGLPSVGTRVDGVPEAVEDGATGLLVQPGDPGALAQAILSIADDPELAQQMGHAGRRRAGQFGTQRFVAAVDDLYQRLLARRHIT